MKTLLHYQVKTICQCTPLLRVLFHRSIGVKQVIDTAHVLHTKSNFYLYFTRYS